MFKTPRLQTHNALNMRPLKKRDIFKNIQISLPFSGPWYLFLHSCMNSLQELYFFPLFDSITVLLTVQVSCSCHNCPFIECRLQSLCGFPDVSGSPSGILVEWSCSSFVESRFSFFMNKIHHKLCKRTGDVKGSVLECASVSCGADCRVASDWLEHFLSVPLRACIVIWLCEFCSHIK